ERLPHGGGDPDRAPEARRCARRGAARPAPRGEGEAGRRSRGGGARGDRARRRGWLERGASGAGAGARLRAARRRSPRAPRGLRALPRRRALLRSTPMSERKIRIRVAKPGLGGHDRGAKIIARALRDAGFEVIYTGLHQSPEMIVSAAIQEDVDGIGLSIMSGAHMTLAPAVVDLLEAQGANDIKVFLGGIIPQDDIPVLKEKKVQEVFLPGTPTTEIIAWVRENVRPRSRAA